MTVAGEPDDPSVPSGLSLQETDEASLPRASPCSSPAFVEWVGRPFVTRSPELARAWALARCFPSPLWSWLFFVLVLFHVSIHVWLIASIAFMHTPFLWMLDDPFYPAPQYWHDDLIADQEIARGVQVLAILIWTHVTVAMWIWILLGIRSWTTPLRLQRLRGVASAT